MDLGLTRDRTVACVVHRNGGVVVDAIRTWAGTRGRPVDLAEVEAEVLRLAHAFGARVTLDPFQAVLLAQRLRAAGVQTAEYMFTAESRRRLFGLVLQLVQDGHLKSFPHEALRQELLALEVSEGAGGWRVDHRPGRFDDHVVALGLAAHAATERKGLRFGIDYGLL